MGVNHHVPLLERSVYCRVVGRGSAYCFIRIIIHNGFMISERDESRLYAIPVVHSPVDAERDKSRTHRFYSAAKLSYEYR